jgi:3,4-dihydroxy 2-butanone 4-phosphate synthase
MNADGTMMRGASLERYAAQHGLVALTIAELADHLQKLKDGQAETVDDEVLEMAATV